MPGFRSNFAFVTPRLYWSMDCQVRIVNSILLSRFVHIKMKSCQGNYEGDGNGIFYVFIQVTDDQHLSGETNF